MCDRTTIRFPWVITFLRRWNQVCGYYDYALFAIAIAVTGRKTKNQYDAFHYMGKREVTRQISPLGRPISKSCIYSCGKSAIASPLWERPLKIEFVFFCYKL